MYCIFIIIVVLSLWCYHCIIHLKNEADKVFRTGPILLAPSLMQSSISAVAKACTFVVKIPFLHPLSLSSLVSSQLPVYPIFSTINLCEKMQSRSNFICSHNSLQFPHKEMGPIKGDLFGSAFSHVQISTLPTVLSCNLLQQRAKPLKLHRW